MKRKFYFLSFVLIILTFIVKAQQIDLAVDGGFEATTLGSSTATGWDFLGPKDSVIFTIDTSKHSGSLGLKVEQVKRSASAQLWAVQVVNSKLLVDKGAFYRFVIWAKADSAGRKVNLTVGNFSYSEIGQMYGVSLTNAWKKYPMIVYNAGEDSVRAPIHIVNIGKYYFDDFSFIQSELAEAYVVPTGDSILLNFGWALNTIAANFDNTAFGVNVGANIIDVSKVTQKSSQKNILYLSLASKIKSTDAAITINYTGTQGNLKYTTPQNSASATVADIFYDPIENHSVYTGAGSSIQNINDQNSISIYPNPATSEIQIKNITNVNKVEIYNMVGVKIRTVYKISENKLDISELKSGIYFFSVYSGNSLNNLTFIKK